MSQLEMDFNSEPLPEPVAEKPSDGMTSNRILTTPKGTQVRTIRRIGGSLWLVEVLVRGGFYTAPLDITELTESQK